MAVIDLYVKVLITILILGNLILSINGLFDYNIIETFFVSYQKLIYSVFGIISLYMLYNFYGGK